VHDWLVTYRGGEKVLEALLSLYPEAPIYTLFYSPERMPDSIRNRKVHVPTLLNSFKKLRKLCLPLLPNAIESLDLSAYDLVISTSSCVAKGAITAKDAKHLCYLHSPMRYIWDQQDEYLKGVAHIPGAAWGIKAMTPRLRRWDIESAKRVDQFVANSSFVAKRAKEYYGCDAHVVHPPIDTSRFQPLSQKRGGYFLAAGALVSYKRFDLAIEACKQQNKKLIIAGSGPMERQLRQMAGAETEFIINPDDAKFTDLLQNADALLFPGVEDFGMIAVESMAAGTPVIAYRQGGALDFISEGISGCFFDEPNPASLAEALRSFAPDRFDATKLASHAHSFGPEAFLEAMRREISAL
jgi:glycosyltransferase involved in cell wall biosynthesis